jgi:hypothetical protein
MKNEGNTSGVSLLNLEVVCMPKKVGCLGLKKYQATKFAMKWTWKLHEQRDCLWSSFAIQIYSKSWYVTGPVILKKRGSFFGASPQTLEPMK